MSETASMDASPTVRFLNWVRAASVDPEHMVTNEAFYDNLKGLATDYLAALRVLNPTLGAIFGGEAIPSTPNTSSTERATASGGDAND